MADRSKKLSGKRPDIVQKSLGDARSSFLKAGSIKGEDKALPWESPELLAMDDDKAAKKPVFIRLSPIEKAKLDYLREHAGINMQQFGKMVLMAAVDAELQRILGDA